VASLVVESQQAQAAEQKADRKAKDAEQTVQALKAKLRNIERNASEQIVHEKRVIASLRGEQQKLREEVDRAQAGEANVSMQRWLRQWQHLTLIAVGLVAYVVYVMNCKRRNHAAKEGLDAPLLQEEAEAALQKVQQRLAQAQIRNRTLEDELKMAAAVEGRLTAELRASMSAVQSAQEQKLEADRRAAELSVRAAVQASSASVNRSPSPLRRQHERTVVGPRRLISRVVVDTGPEGLNCNTDQSREGLDQTPLLLRKGSHVLLSPRGFTTRSDVTLNSPPGRGADLSPQRVSKTQL